MIVDLLAVHLPGSWPDRLCRRLAQLVAFVGIRKEPIKMLCKGAGVTRRHDIAVDAMLNVIGTGVIAYHNREPRRHCLGHNERRPLLNRGQNKEIRGAVLRRQLIAASPSHRLDAGRESPKKAHESPVDRANET